MGLAMQVYGAEALEALDALKAPGGCCAPHSALLLPATPPGASSLTTASLQEGARRPFRGMCLYVRN